MHVCFDTAINIASVGGEARKSQIENENGKKANSYTVIEQHGCTENSLQLHAKKINKY